MSDSVAKAILAGGCFRGMEDLFRKRPGVTSTRVGYTGGDIPNATYGTHEEMAASGRPEEEPEAEQEPQAEQPQKEVSSE